MAVCVFFGTFARTDMPGDIMGGANFMAYFPFLADIEGMKWLIAGGGGVALRKVRDLLPYGAVIEVVSPDMCPCSYRDFVIDADARFEFLTE